MLLRTANEGVKSAPHTYPLPSTWCLLLLTVVAMHCRHGQCLPEACKHAQASGGGPVSALQESTQQCWDSPLEEGRAGGGRSKPEPGAGGSEGACRANPARGGTMPAKAAASCLLRLSLHRLWRALSASSCSSGAYVGPRNVTKAGMEPASCTEQACARQPGNLPAEAQHVLVRDELSHSCEAQDNSGHLMAAITLSGQAAVAAETESFSGG